MNGYLVGTSHFCRTFALLPQCLLQSIPVEGIQSIINQRKPILVECVDQAMLQQLAQYSANGSVAVCVQSAELYFSALDLGFFTLRLDTGWEAHAAVLFERCLEHAQCELRLQAQEEAQQSLDIRELLHDLNNALAIMIGKSQLLKQAELSDEARLIVEQTLEAGRHANAIFKQFSAQRKAHKQPQAITEIVYTTQRTAQLLHHGMNPKIDLQMDLPKGDFLIPLSSAAYTRILLNLLLNAQDAMPQGGELCLRISSGWHPDRYGIATAVLEVSDTGTGIPLELQQRIFDPFYTTKGEQGTGLGLSAVQNLINRCGGRVQLHSHPLQGTTFELHFPLVEQPPCVRVLWLSPQSHWDAQADRVLRQSGFELLRLAEPAQLASVHSQTTPIEGILIDEADLESSQSVIAQLKNEKPQLKILLIQSKQRNKMKGDYPVLQAPFTPEQLLQSLQQFIA